MERNQPNALNEFLIHYILNFNIVSLLLADQMHLIIQNLNGKIYVVWNCKRHEIKDHSNIFSLFRRAFFNSI